MTAPTAAPRANVIEKPMLFSDSMVRAILEGRKTVTRRVCKRAHADDRAESACAVCKCSDGSFIAWYGPKQDCDQAAYQAFTEKQYPNGGGFFPPHPVGSRIWVKETWRSAKSLDNLSPRQMAKAALDAGYRKPWAPTQYEADGARNNWEPYFDGDRIEPGKKRVSIHMPRWASRIALEVTDVRVERLQDITPQDALDEGVTIEFNKGSFPENQQFPDDFDAWSESRRKEWFAGTARAMYAAQCDDGQRLIKAFRDLWESINGSDSWAANPWVWVYTFKHLSPEAPHGI